MHLFAPPGVVVGPLALGGFSYSNAKMLGRIPTPTFIIEPFFTLTQYHQLDVKVYGDRGKAHYVQLVV